MQSLWRSALHRWLGDRGRPGVDDLCDHLRRDIGLDHVDPADPAAGVRRPAEPIRPRILSGDRMLLLLHESR